MVTLKTNGKSHQIDVPSDNVLGMTATKFGCGMTLCSTCTIQLDGQAIRSGVMPASAA